MSEYYFVDTELVERLGYKEKEFYHQLKHEKKLEIAFGYILKQLSKENKIRIHFIVGVIPKIVFYTSNEDKIVYEVVGEYDIYEDVENVKKYVDEFKILKDFLYTIDTEELDKNLKDEYNLSVALKSFRKNLELDNIYAIKRFVYNLVKRYVESGNVPEFRDFEEHFEPNPKLRRRLPINNKIKSKNCSLILKDFIKEDNENEDVESYILEDFKKSGFDYMIIFIYTVIREEVWIFKREGDSLSTIEIRDCPLSDSVEYISNPNNWFTDDVLDKLVSSTLLSRSSYYGNKAFIDWVVTQQYNDDLLRKIDNKEY